MGISTHVLDTSLGRPASGMPVDLEWQSSVGNWELVATGETDSDGRCQDLIPRGTSVSPGSYRLRFNTEEYFSKVQAEGLYPEVVVTFAVRDPSAHYHIPLLLSPNGYTTYRGS